MRSTIRTTAILAGLLGAAANAAVAQSANINATATVYTAINVTGAQALAFGNVFPGVNKVVAATDAAAGRFDLTGQNSANVNLTFTLPTTLSSGANTLPIGTWSGYRNGNNSQTGGTAFVPSASATAAAFSPSGNLFVFVGATVSPAAAQAAGSYTGVVTLTAAYF